MNDGSHEINNSLPEKSGSICVRKNIVRNTILLSLPVACKERTQLSPSLRVSARSPKLEEDKMRS
jgi:hypothetical protein